MVRFQPLRGLVREFLYFFRVLAAFLADLERSAFERFEAAFVAWRDRAVFDAAARPSRLSAFELARERLADGFDLEELRPLRASRAACLRVSSEVFPFSGGGSLTPARRAFDSPIAIACLAERAPCLPSLMCSISSFTNSPAWVLGDFPSRLSCFARSTVSFSGIMISSTRRFCKECASVRCTPWRAS